MQRGDYVIATKYSDGRPGDQWYVGFYDREECGRHYVTDGEGNQARGNGFMRVKKISAERGEWLLKNGEQIELGYVSLWSWVRKKMELTTDQQAEVRQEV